MLLPFISEAVEIFAEEATRLFSLTLCFREQLLKVGSLSKDDVRDSENVI